jgi:mono/diheme cytochrome c family protein
MSVFLRRVLVLSASVLCVESFVTSAHALDDPPGKVPYERVCRVCHGPEGRGNQGPRLVPFEMEVDELLVRVREGGGEMPPISETRVSDDEVKQIAAYLKSLNEQ